MALASAAMRSIESGPAPRGVAPTPRLSNVSTRYRRGQGLDLRAPAVAGDADALDAEHGRAAAGGAIGQRDVVDRQGTDRSGHEGSNRT